MTDENNAARDALIAELRLTLTATFVPQSQSRYKIGPDKRSGGYGGKGEPCINWRVRLFRNGAGGQIWETDYSQGAGHLPDPMRYGWNPTACQVRMTGEACETGRNPANGVRLNPPTLDDVLYSLLLDGQADEMTFDEWCADYGYDVDSRKAFATYEECRNVGAALRRHLGAGNVARLRELFRDY